MIYMKNIKIKISGLNLATISLMFKTRCKIETWVIFRNFGEKI